MSIVRGLLACLASAVLLAGCAGAVEEQEEDEVVVASATYGLTNGSVKWLNGTYTSCMNRSGSWSTRVSGNGAMDYPALTVVKNDAACQLKVTAVVADQSYAASPTITLGTSYAGTASTFGSGGSQFLGNAKLDTAGFAGDFQISFIYGDTSAPPIVTNTISAVYASSEAVAVANQVAPPGYTIDLSTLKFTVNLLQLVYYLQGNAVLVANAPTGSNYVIEAGALAANPTYAQVESAYNAGSKKTISGTGNVTIAAADFNVATLGLIASTNIRNIIIRRVEGGVPAYQVFRITFQS